MEREEERIEHPSFGQIYVGRVHCSGNISFYGSELPQRDYIRLDIQRSELSRTLTEDHFFPKEDIISVRMTYSQFTEMITSLNMGSGACCTIEQINGENIDFKKDIPNRKTHVHEGFKNRMKQFAMSILKEKEEAKRIVKKKNLSKDDVQRLSILLDSLVAEISGNIPFFMECFQETMDTVVKEAKLEIDNAIQRKINIAGMQQLLDNSEPKVQLTEGNVKRERTK